MAIVNGSWPRSGPSYRPPGQGRFVLWSASRQSNRSRGCRRGVGSTRRRPAAFGSRNFTGRSPAMNSKRGRSRGDPLQSLYNSGIEGPLTEAKQSPASAGMHRRFAEGPRRQSGTQPCRHGDRVASRAIVVPRETENPVRFEIPLPTREAGEAWSRYAVLGSEGFLVPRRLQGSARIGTWQYARLLYGRISEIGSHSTTYGTYSMQRAKASLISSAPRASAHYGSQIRLGPSKPGSYCPISRYQGRRCA